MFLFQIQKHKQFESKRTEKIYHINSNQKRIGVAILISKKKIDFKTKKYYYKSKKGHFIMIRVNSSKVNNNYKQSPKYLKQKQNREKKNNSNSQRLQYSTFNNRQTIIQKLGKDTEDMNNTINHLDLKDIYRVLHPAIAEHSS